MVRRRHDLILFTFHSVFKYSLISQIFKKRFKFRNYTLLIRRKKLFLRKRQFILSTYFSILFGWGLYYVNCLKFVKTFIFFTNNYLFFSYVNLFSCFYERLGFQTNFFYCSIYYKLDLIQPLNKITSRLGFLNLNRYSHNFFFLASMNNNKLLAVLDTKDVITFLSTSCFFFTTYLVLINYKFMIFDLN